MENAEDEAGATKQSAIADMYASAEKEFNKRWNWVLNCKSVAEWLNEPYYTTLHRNLYEVLTFATLIKEQVAIIKSKNK